MISRHEEIKEQLLNEAKDMGYKSTDFRIGSTDPFFVGSPKDYTDARWAASLWDKMMASRRKSLHLRGFHYWIQSQGIKKPDGEIYAYKDPTKDWSYMLHCAQIARYLGIGEWRNLVDLKHPNPVDFDNYYVGSGLARSGEVNIQEELDSKLTGLVDEFVSEITRQAPRYNTEGYQVYHCEVWCEKQSMGSVIEPQCRKYEATYQPLVGQSSVEKVNLAATRAIEAAKAGKKVRIFYIADFDRYGWSMVSAVARKIEFFLKQEDADVDIKLTRLGLNEEHINKWKLPYAPKHGEKVVELDALEAIHPGELGKIVAKALEPYYDAEKPAVVRKENERIRELVRELVEAKLRQPLEAAFKGINIADIAGNLDLTEAIDQDFEVPEPGHEVEDVGKWVLDSSRDYWEQVEAYKAYKGERQEESAD